MIKPRNLRFDDSIDVDFGIWAQQSIIDILDFVANTKLTLCSTLYGHPQCLGGEEFL